MKVLLDYVSMLCIIAIVVLKCLYRWQHCVLACASSDMNIASLTKKIGREIKG
jgi:hypothetical protein